MIRPLYEPGSYNVCVVDQTANWGTPIYGPARQAFQRKCPYVTIDSDEQRHIDATFITLAEWDEIVKANEE